MTGIVVATLLVLAAASAVYVGVTAGWWYVAYWALGVWTGWLAWGRRQ